MSHQNNVQIIQPILDRLNIGIGELSAYLDIRESSLRHVLAGRRALGEDKFLSLVILDSLTDAFAEKSEGSAKSVSTELPGEKFLDPEMEDHRWDLQVKLRKLEKKLVRMELDFTSHTKAYDTLLYIHQHQSELNDHQRAWVEGQKQHVEKCLLLNNARARQIVRAQIAGLTAELEVLSTFE